MTARRVVSAVVVVVAALTGLVLILIGTLTPTTPPPSPTPTPPGSAWRQVDASAPEEPAGAKPDVVIHEDVPLRIEIPSIGLDSATLPIPATQAQPIMDWNLPGDITPPRPWHTSLVRDATIKGGGLFGTDAQSSGMIIGHATPWDWPEDELGVFQYLLDVKIGDSVAITTANGKLCYNVAERDVILKALAGDKYRRGELRPGICYLAVCLRERTNISGSTKDNLVLALQLNQQQTNTGSCGSV